MIKYSPEIVLKTINEISKKFYMTQHLSAKKVQYRADKDIYVVTLNDNTLHTIEHELINTYIESFGEKGGIDIAGLLIHDIELEESIHELDNRQSDDVWDGDMYDVEEYLRKKKEKEGRKDTD
ncbi:MAG: hypothetical protein ABH885_06650 [Candidatus Omnitrophota bacterium]